jgi:hypothetical protein
MSNNSFIALEQPTDLAKEKTQERGVTLTRIIQAVENCEAH